MQTKLELLKNTAIAIIFVSTFAVMGCQKHDDAQVSDAADSVDSAAQAAQAAQAATDAAFAAAPAADNVASTVTMTVSKPEASAPMATS